MPEITHLHETEGGGMLLRSTPAGLDDVSTSQRTVTGLIVPYDRPTEVQDPWSPPYMESFARGAFARAIENPGSVKFLGQHNRRVMPLGRMTEMWDSAAGPMGTFRVSKTQAGDEYLELARDGAVDGLSVGFRGIDPPDTYMPRRGESVVRKAVDLDEVSGVPWPAYTESRLSEVRSQVIREALERAGKTLSSATLAELRHVLDLIATADDNVDEAQEVLSSLMGVPNPDKDEADEPDGDDGPQDSPGTPGGRALSADLLTRRMRVMQLTSTVRRAASAARNPKEN